MLNLLITFLALSGPALAVEGEQTLRQVQARGTLYRNVIEKGSFTLKGRQKVCDFEGEFPLFDLAANPHGQTLKNFASCETTINGEPGLLQLSGMGAIEQAAGDKPGKKSFTLIIEAYHHLDKKPYESYSYQISSVSTPDLSASALTLSVGPAAFAKQRKKLEVFSGLATFTDANQ